MTGDKEPSSEIDSRSERAGFRSLWWLFLVLGIVLLALGAVAIGAAVATRFSSSSTVVLFGFLVFVAGVAQIVVGFWAGRWPGFLPHLLIGVLYAVVGYLIVDARAESMLPLRLVLAAFLLVGGSFRMVAALVFRFEAWNWVLLNGVIGLLLGVMMNEAWPWTGPLVMGLFPGVEMILNGVAWVMLSVVLRRQRREDAEG
jgi:uncharacterized membrane protein HdeD (DUF308 family)